MPTNKQIQVAHQAPSRLPLTFSYPYKFEMHTYLQITNPWPARRCEWNRRVAQQRTCVEYFRVAVSTFRELGY